MKRTPSQAILAALAAAALAATAPAASVATTPAPPAAGPTHIASAGTQVRSAVVVPHTVPDEDGCSYADFQDNPYGSPFYRAVRWMACQDISVGYAGHVYRKDRTVTRAETVTFLYRWLDADYEPPRFSPFGDVTVGDPFFTPITWAVSEHLTVGYASGLFKPQQSVTRAEFAEFLYRTMGRPDFDYAPGDPLPFADVWEHTRQGRAVVWLGHHGIAVGDTRDCFHPTRSITRAEAAQWLYRTDRLVEEGVLEPAVG